MVTRSSRLLDASGEFGLFRRPFRSVFLSSLAKAENPDSTGALPQNWTRLLQLAARWALLVQSLVLCAALPASDSGFDDADKTSTGVAEDKSVEAVAEAARAAVVVVTHFGREGQEDGVGSGFVVATNGLIATCLHVIGEARPITVRLPNGQRYEVTEVHAWDRKLDLAVIRISANDLMPLPLGDSDALKQGARVVAMGNPLGLEHSVVDGVISARREFEGVEMFQLAIPIEQGNSGGPLLDRQGRVHGLLTMKSLMSANLGFAMPVNALKKLLDKPNPVPMNRWLTIGALNPKDWTPVMGARWSQRAGRIQVEGLGEGFGGRALCLSQKPTPPRPYEVSVTVRLDDEAGAAGLAFAADGEQKHYGFYPTAGNLRLTRFDGPNVFTWHILKELQSPHYRPGEWNRLKVRVENETIRCFVNDHLVIESDDRELTRGRVGLAKFRNTKAEFKNFQLGTNVPSALAMPPEVVSAITNQIRAFNGTPEPDFLATLQSDPGASLSILHEAARTMDRKAAQLRALAATVHQRAVQSELAKLFQAPEEKIDLFQATLLLAKLDNPDLDLDGYRRQLDGMADEIKAQLPDSSDDSAKLDALNKYLFVENGFHGSHTDYYNRANSYLNNVLDDREGQPITLSVLFLELARRIGLANVAGLSLPRHFMLKYTPEEGTEKLIDAFDGGKILSGAEAEKFVLATTGSELTPKRLQPATKKEIIVRMLRNLLNSAREADSPRDALRYLDLIVALEPSNAVERLDRAMTRVWSGDKSGAKEDLQWILEKEPPELNLDQVSRLYRSLR